MIKLYILPELADTENACRLTEKFETTDTVSSDTPTLVYDADGLSLHADGNVLRGDFSHLYPRLRPDALSRELLVRAAKIKNADGKLYAIDATAGLGEDAFFLAATGFEVTAFEQNPVIYELLYDALKRALYTDGISHIAKRIHPVCADSTDYLTKLERTPDVVFLDPMFPERQKSALVKKKLQMIQKLEKPCVNERSLLFAAINADPKKLIIKRPPKGPYLANVKPDHSLEGKSVRFDCLVSPKLRIHTYKEKLI